MITVVKGNLRGQEIDLVSGLIRPLFEITASLAIGSVIGFIGGKLLTAAKDQEAIIFVLGIIVLWVTGIASMIDVSELIANMACGAIIVNMYPHLLPKIRSGFSAFLPIFYALFFIIGGAHLDISSFPAVWKLAAVYFIVRTFGKITGASVGAVLGKALPQVRKLIGFGLLPQVGAAIALALVVQQELGKGDLGQAGIDIAYKVINVLLITTLLTEFIGPYLTKISLFKAGEAKE